MVDDLHWFRHILIHGKLARLPLAMFGVPDVHVYMDASNEGLAVLSPASREYIQIKFSLDVKFAYCQHHFRST